jgi:hypothetical protein
MIDFDGKFGSEERLQNWCPPTSVTAKCSREGKFALIFCNKFRMMNG